MTAIMKFTATFLVAILALTCTLLDGSENAVLVVNAKSASSKLIANHYIHLRNIPRENVIYLTDVPQKELVTINEFRTKILIPIVGAISNRKINRHIDYIIYSSDFPSIINVKNDAKKLLRTNNSDASFAANSKMLNPYVSITSATFFLNQVLNEKANYLSLTANTYARSPLNQLLTQPFVGERQQEFQKALSLAKTEKYERAIEKLEAIAEKNPLQLAVLYWLARTCAWNGDTESAIQWLKRSIAVGWSYRDYTLADTAFNQLRDDAEFQTVVALMPNTPARYGPSTGFRNNYLWGPNGMINSESNQGNRYVLSAMLAVNRNQGNSESESINYLTKSVEADASRPKGRFYFTKTNDIRTKTRQRGIEEAIVELKQLGYVGEVVTQKIPTGKNRIVGMTIGTANFQWPSSNQIVPGAICENLTSFGGRLLPGTKQTKLSTFLKHGAAGSSGTVIEPFAVQAKFPHPRIHVHYVRGCTLAESFFQSVTGPFQLLIVGDPLCRPWADIPKITVAGDLKEGSSISGKIDFQVSAQQSGKSVRLIEMYLDGRLVRKINGTTTGNISLQTTEIPDGYHEFRFVAIANGTIQTRGSRIVPVTVNNRDQNVQLKAKSKVAKIHQDFEFSVEAPKANEIVLSHNGLEIARKNSDTAYFKVPARQFGRGPVKVEATAIYDKTAVRSLPLSIKVDGAISTKIPVLKSPSKPKPKK